MIVHYEPPYVAELYSNEPMSKMPDTERAACGITALETVTRGDMWAPADQPEMVECEECKRTLTWQVASNAEDIAVLQPSAENQWRPS